MKALDDGCLFWGEVNQIHFHDLELVEVVMLSREGDNSCQGLVRFIGLLIWVEGDAQMAGFPESKTVQANRPRISWVSRHQQPFATRLCVRRDHSPFAWW